MTDITAEVIAATNRLVNGDHEFDDGPDAPGPRIIVTVEQPAPLVTLEPVDWGPILADGIPQLEYLAAPYLPARKRVWAVGAAEAGKSIWAAWWAARLTHQGVTVCYLSQENGLEEEARRFVRLAPDFAYLNVFVDQGVDLALPAHVGALLEVSAGAGLVVIDTLSACWSGDEDSNTAIAALDRDVLLPVAREIGATCLILDHTGNPQPFVRRKGVSAPRGASAKGQKADHLLEFKAAGDSEFTVEHGKARGARKEPLRRYRVVDTDGGAGLDLEEIEQTSDEKTEEIAAVLVELVAAEPGMSTRTLADKAKKASGAGTGPVADAMRMLEHEAPPRVVVAREGQAKVWRPAPAALFAAVDDGEPGPAADPDEVDRLAELEW